MKCLRSGPARVVALLCALSIPILLHAQVERALGRGFDAAMATNAPEWHPDRTVVDRVGQHQKRWRYGDLKVSVSYSVEGSPQEAAQVLKRKIMLIQVGPAEPLQAFADDAYLLAQYNATGITRLFFRRGAAIVEVSAPAESLARRVAALFLIEVDKVTRAQSGQR